MTEGQRFSMDRAELNRQGVVQANALLKRRRGGE